jgi:hypothetical protein
MYENATMKPTKNLKSRREEGKKLIQMRLI